MANENLNKTGAPQSKIDSFSGTHTTSFFVAALAIVIIIALVVLAFKDTPSENISSVLGNALLALVGFFAGSQISKKA